VSSKGDGSMAFYTGHKTTQMWSRECGIDFSDKSQVLAWFKTEYSGWNNVWEELFKNAALTFLPRPKYCMPLDHTWKTLPNLTMLGDAAHLMPPYAGEGVNMAMQDVLELSRCLTGENFADVHAAIAAYEKQMLTRSSATARLTLESINALHETEAIPYLIGVIS